VRLLIWTTPLHSWIRTSSRSSTSAVTSLTTMAVAIQPAPALPRQTSNPVPITVPRPTPTRRMSGKENLIQVKSTSFSGSSNLRSRRERPCDACRRRKSRCVIHEGAVLCVLCEFHKQECTFVQDPQPRKRKVVIDDSKKDSLPKKRFVGCCHALCKLADLICLDLSTL
jgi:hypothetical protein